MKFAALISPLALLACASPPPAAAPAPVSACGIEQWSYLVGQPQSDIPRDRLPAGARVVCHNCPVTMDFRADRLNILLGPQNRVRSLRCQ